MIRQTTKINDAIVSAAVDRIDNNCEALELGPLKDYDLAWAADTTALVIGNGTKSGRYAVAGRMCYAEGVVTIGSVGVTVGVGAYSVALPKPMRGTWSLGQCLLYDASTGNRYPGVVIGSGSRAYFAVGTAHWGPGTPVVPASGDEMRFSIWYPC